MIIRDQTLKIVENILMGPNPLDGYVQENGQEILYFDSPLKTYITGVLFPKMIIDSELDEEENQTSTLLEDPLEESSDKSETGIKEKSYGSIAEPTTDLETSKINNYRQSAMGITVCIPNDAPSVNVNISVGSYFEKEINYPREQRDEQGNKEIVLSESSKKCYLRKQHSISVDIPKHEMPDISKRHRDDYILIDDSGETVKGLCLAVTFRMLNENEQYSIYTFTLINTQESKQNYPKAELCWFQAFFSLECPKEFCPLPDNFCNDISDSDYKLNALLYRNVKTYGIGHGCAATWKPGRVPNVINATVMPEYEVKAIKPGTHSKAELSMITYANDFDRSVSDLRILCDEYENWINNKTEEISQLDKVFVETAEKQMTLARECLSRMRSGLDLLIKDEKVRLAFQLANKAMLMQQIHYKMPLVSFDGYDADELEYILKSKIDLPEETDPSTWYNPDPEAPIVYGKWRPFQIAFILLNLVSMNDKDSQERKIVDLIWFPTGGGKTEAYLGLTAFTILLRRIKKKSDSGTAVIMRYTLRLLTAQQYERASSLICSLEMIRSRNKELLGDDRITIGLWVGDSLTDNNSSSAISRIKKIQKGEETTNVSVVLKCPWCGASMETFVSGKSRYTPGYVVSKENNRQRVKLCCGNPDCDFHNEKNPLPLQLFDDDIYENPPALLFGTVDKFAMLPFKPQAKILFGGDGEYTPPELIIQDELHLITGPLGSTVGLYETLISELCRCDGKRPKIIASTATISHAAQQCNALYDCGEDNVFQFPVQGLSYDDCFFAEEDNKSPGRKYVGLFGSAAPSSATASIYAFAAFLYAVKSLEVENESLRDPYWTNLCYFGSMRELGQAATWYIADIKERLEVLYRNRLESMNDKTERRYLYDDGLEELTSRMSNFEIPQILKKLEIKCTDPDKRALNMCLATNMVSVGVDVSRLGLMTVTGQPKSFSEYIQATSRVGRSAAAPGLVLVIYNTSKPRDKSYYERFQMQHSQLYKNVEPTSVTPFSRPLRERALHAIFVALHRFNVDKGLRNDAQVFPTEAEFNKILKTILDRAADIDPDEREDIEKQLRRCLTEWKAWSPSKYEDFSRIATEDAPLLYSSNLIRPALWGERGWPTPMSMRNVDRECQLDCSHVLDLEEEDDD